MKPNLVIIKVDESQNVQMGIDTFLDRNKEILDIEIIQSTTIK